MKTLTYLFAMIISFHAMATNPKEAYDMMMKGKAVIVDVRELDEIQYGMIENSIWFPKSQLMANKQLMNDFKSMVVGKKVFLYCKAGKRAEICKDFLKGQGIDAENLGGFDTLKNSLPTKSLIQRVNRMQECKI